jgi:hypothetical protein
MKALEIKNFTKSVMDIYSDYFEIKYATDTGDKYVIGIDTRDVVSLKPLGNKHYKMAIHKDIRDDLNSYQLWLWDMERNMSYPMGIWKDNLDSTSSFTQYLTNMLELADRGEFSGERGNRVTLK